MPPTQTALERFSGYILMLCLAVSKHTGWDARMPPLLIGQISIRLNALKGKILRLAARIAAGKYRRRPYAPRPGQKGRQPQNPLPRERNWLEPLMPEIVQYRGHLERLLHDPEIVALIQAAPEAMRPPFRSLCRLLGWPPPPVLTKPRAKSPPREAPPNTQANTAKAPPPAARRPPQPAAPPRPPAALRKRQRPHPA